MTLDPDTCASVTTPAALPEQVAGYAVGAANPADVNIAPSPPGQCMDLPRGARAYVVPDDGGLPEFMGAAGRHSAPGPGPSPLDHRVVLLGLHAFLWLKTLQAHAPTPRMDLRYLVDGTLAVLQVRPSLQPAWLSAARAALFEHLARFPREGVAGRVDQSGGEGGHDGAAAAVRMPAMDQAPRPVRSEPGTVHSTSVDEGAHADDARARTVGQRGVTSAQDPCKALHLSLPMHAWLKGVQGTTHDPRLEFRFLIEGALALMRQERHWLPLVVVAARAALAEHLLQLRGHSLPQHFLHTLP